MKRRDHLRGRHSRGPQEENQKPPPPPPPDSDPGAARPEHLAAGNFANSDPGVQSAPATRVLRIAKDHPDPLMRLFVQRKLHQLRAEDSAAVNWSL
jgi:hypothetical protein